MILCDCVGYQRDTFAFYESLAIRWVVKAKKNSESKDLSELMLKPKVNYVMSRVAKLKEPSLFMVPFKDIPEQEREKWINQFKCFVNGCRNDLLQQINDKIAQQKNKKMKPRASIQTNTKLHDDISMLQS